ncbi:hypothetical protein GCM10010360_65230 [Streptomyces nogalater]
MGDYGGGPARARGARNATKKTLVVYAEKRCEGNGDTARPRQVDAQRRPLRQRHLQPALTRTSDTVRHHPAPATPSGTVRHQGLCPTHPCAPPWKIRWRAPWSAR